MQSVVMHTWSWDFDFVPNEGSRRIVEKTGPGAFTDGVLTHMLLDLQQHPMEWSLSKSNDTGVCKCGVCVMAWYMFGAATPGNEPGWQIPPDNVLKSRAYVRHGYAGSWLSTAQLRPG